MMSRCGYKDNQKNGSRRKIEINAITEPTGIGAAQLQYKEINQANDWFDKLERSVIKV